MQEKVNFRLSYGDKIKDYSICNKEFSERLFVVEKILNCFKDFFKSENIIEYKEALNNNNFLFSNAIEVYSEDELGNSVKYNLIDLFFDKSFFPKEKPTNKNEKEIYLYADFQKCFFELSMKIREKITMTYIIFNIAFRFLSKIENGIEVTKHNKDVINFLKDSLNRCINPVKEYIKSLKEGPKESYIYLKNKIKLFNDMKTEFDNKIKNLKITDLEEDSIKIPDVNNTKNNVYDNDFNNKLKKYFDYFSEAVKLNNNAIFHILLEFYNLIKNT